MTRPQSFIGEDGKFEQRKYSSIPEDSIIIRFKDLKAWTALLSLGFQYAFQGETPEDRRFGNDVLKRLRNLEEQEKEIQ